MRDQATVGEGDGVDDLEQQAQPGGEVELSGGGILLDVRAVDKLHNQGRRPVRRLRDVERASNAGVGE